MITLKHSLATNSTSTISLLQNKHTNVFSPTTNKKQQKLKINQKLVTHPNLANLLMRVNPADLFYSTGLELHWAELYLTPHNPLSSVTLTSAISCHDSISKNNIIYTAIGTFTGQIYLVQPV